MTFWSLVLADCPRGSVAAIRERLDAEGIVFTFKVLVAEKNEYDKCLTFPGGLADLGRAKLLASEQGCRCFYVQPPANGPHGPVPDE